MENRLKIAIQKKGRLFEKSLWLLKECGIKVDNGRDQLKVQARNYPLDILYLRSGDIPQYLEDGVADIGILGQNTLIEAEKNITEVLSLGFSKCRLSIATPKASSYNDLNWLKGKKIATSYPNSLQQFLKRKNIEADIHKISGSVEIAPNIGLADAICDLVSSGSTLFKNNLEEQEIILKSEACIAQTNKLSEAKSKLLDQLVFRIQSILNAQKNKYLLMNAPDESIPAITQLLPGMKSPTVMPLAEKGWSSIHTVIAEDRFWEIIDQLKNNGAEGILIIPIQKMIQ